MRIATYCIFADVFLNKQMYAVHTNLFCCHRHFDLQLHDPWFTA
jgi:hypothetical protein